MASGKVKRTVTLTEMSEEYQYDISTKMTHGKKVAEDVYHSIRRLFRDEKFNLSISFRAKSIERSIEKDLKYKGIHAKTTQVKDLFAARLIANPDNPDDAEEMKQHVLQRFNEEFYQHPDIKFDCESKTKYIEFRGQMVRVDPLYVTFNDHIELQVVTSEECNVLTQTHEEYIHERKRTDKVIATMIAMHILVILMYR